MVLSFSSKNGLILCNTFEFRLKGINVTGIESAASSFNGLWATTMLDLLNIVKNNGFNTMRVPITVQFGLQLDTLLPRNPDGSFTINYTLNPDLANLTTAQTLDVFFTKAAALGLLIMLDMHVLQSGGDITPLWYDNTVYTQAQVIQSWQNIVTRYSKNWNFIACDLKNEPHDACTWGDNNVLTDIVPYYETCGNAILKINPNLLIFCEGIQNYAGVSSNWGENLIGVTTSPVKLSDNTKLVYSAHSYGPFVTGYNSTAVDWQNDFGFIKDNATNAITIGETGALATDDAWMTTFTDWLVSKNIYTVFWWNLQPNSVDTGGIMNSDWVTLDAVKLAFCQKINPKPSVITVTNNVPSFVGSVPIPVPTPIPTPIPVPTNGISISTAIGSFWKSGTITNYQLNINLTNNTGKTVKNLNIEVQVGTIITDVWNINQSGLILTLPNYINSYGLTNGSIFSFGGVFQSLPSFSVSNITFL